MVARAASTRFRAPKQRPGPSFIQALERLRAGGLLRLQYIKSQPVWEIDSLGVAPETVALLLGSGEIETCGDALFPGAAGQTWRASSVK